jgi:pilus assembly protein CpaD
MTILNTAKKVTIVALSATFLSGCALKYNGAEQAGFATDRFPIKVNEDTASMEIGVKPGQRSVSSDSKASLTAFVSEYKQRGHGAIKVSSPSGTANASSASRVASSIKLMLADVGLRSSSVNRTTYPASPGDTEAPIILSFARYTATVSECGDWSRNISSSSRNMPTDDFGCSTQHNLAAMVEDPHDLIAPRGMSGADADRRSTVFGKYRDGQPTATARTEAEKVSVSDIE